MPAKIILGIKPNLTIEFDGNDEYLLRRLAFWESIPHLCPLCESAVVFTMRKVTAKQGPKIGQKFTYFGLACVGPTKHECQFSQRNDDDKDFFIREGNRADGKRNWREAFGVHDEDEDDDSSGESSSATFAPIEQTVAIEGLATQKGVSFQEMNKYCVNKWQKGYKQLTREQAIEYHRTLSAL